METIGFQPQSGLAVQPGRPGDGVRPVQGRGIDPHLIGALQAHERAILGVVEFEADEVVAGLDAKGVLRAVPEVVARDRGPRAAAHDRAVVVLAELVAVVLVDECAKVGIEVQAVFHGIGRDLAGDGAAAPVPFAGQAVAAGVAGAAGIDGAIASAGNERNGAYGYLIAGHPAGVIALEGQSAANHFVATRILHEPVGSAVVSGDV